MLTLITVALLTSMGTAQASAVQSNDKAIAPPAKTVTPLSALPPGPGGKSTVMGGEIRDVDPIRDQFTLNVFGAKPVKILFDERTRLYQNGVSVPIRNLRPDDHASVETSLDGTRIFALRIHTLPQVPADRWRGRVSGFNPRTGKLTVTSELSHDPMTLQVPAGTPVASIGQDGSATKQQGPINLVTGSVVDVRFTAGKGGHGIATGIDVLAVPGSTFVFSGNLSSLDLHSGRLVVVDPRDNQSYPIAFEPALLPSVRTFHEGSTVKVTTSFDGTRYVANQITQE
jgi:hypothetical protein